MRWYRKRAYPCRDPFTVAQQDRIDQLGVTVFQIFIVQTQLFQRLGSGVGDHHVGVFQQLMESGHALLRFEVQRNVLLAGVVNIEHRVFLVTELAGDIADAGQTPGITLGVLHLNDLCAQVSHHTGSHRSSDKSGKFQNPNTG